MGRHGDKESRLQSLLLVSRSPCLLVLRTQQMKLYIETVGCQMNELDSELVVASLRKDGYELTPTASATPTRSCSTRAACGSMPKTRFTVRWAG